MLSAANLRSHQTVSNRNYFRKLVSSQDIFCPRTRLHLGGAIVNSFALKCPVNQGARFATYVSDVPQSLYPSSSHLLQLGWHLFSWPRLSLGGYGCQAVRVVAAWAAGNARACLPLPLGHRCLPASARVNSTSDE